MSLNAHARMKSRWPVSFDIEGVPRDPATRNKILSIEANMKISGVSHKGTFNYNSPEQTRYEHQEFPRMVYRGAKSTRVETEDELTEALANGWHLKKSDALDAIAGKTKAVSELPGDEEEDSELPLVDCEGDGEEEVEEDVEESEHEEDADEDEPAVESDVVAPAKKKKAKKKKK